MVPLSAIALGVLKIHPREAQMRKTTKQALALGIYNKTASPSILCYCKYSMKEYTIKIHLYFNMYHIIYNFNKQMNITKAKINSYFLNLALSSSKQLKIQN